MNWPLLMFGGAAAAFAMTLAADRASRLRRARALYALAREARMNYSPLDRFDLAARLRRLPEWIAETTDLRVRDVLYAAHGDERRFVATALRHHTRDARPAMFVIAAAEGLNDHLFREIHPRLSVRRPLPLDAYRDALGWFGAASG